MENLTKPKYLFSFPLSEVLTVLQVLCLLLDRCEPLQCLFKLITGACRSGLHLTDSSGTLNMIRPRFIFVPNVVYHVYIM